MPLIVDPIIIALVILAVLGLYWAVFLVAALAHELRVPPESLRTSSALLLFLAAGLFTLLSNLNLVPQPLTVPLALAPMIPAAIASRLRSYSKPRDFA